MQLDPPNIHSLSGYDLENYVAAIFQFGGYYINRDLTWTTERESDPTKSIDLLQIDVLGFNFHPFGEDRVLVECKGGGTFTDLFKFLGIKSFFSPQLSFFIANNPGSFKEIHKFGKQNGITVVRPAHILDSFQNKSQIDAINFWYWSNSLTDKLIMRETLCKLLGVHELDDNQNRSYGEIRRVLSLLKNHIWRDLDPRDQSIKLEELFKQNKGFVRNLLSIQGIPLVDTENAISQHIICESGAYVILLAKVYYIVSAVRCAIYSLISPDKNYLGKLSNDPFKDVVTKLIDNITLAINLPKFIQFWIFLCGGMLDYENEDVKKFSEFLDIREDTFHEYISLLEQTFTIVTGIGEIQWSLNERDSIKEFNAVPNSIRGLGIKFRNSLDIETDNFIYKQKFIDRFSEI